MIPHCPKTWPQTSDQAVLSSIEVPMSPGKDDNDDANDDDNDDFEGDNGKAAYPLA